MRSPLLRRVVKAGDPTVRIVPLAEYDPVTWDPQRLAAAEAAAWTAGRAEAQTRIAADEAAAEAEAVTLIADIARDIETLQRQVLADADTEMVTVTVRSLNQIRLLPVSEEDQGPIAQRAQAQLAAFRAQCPLAILIPAGALGAQIVQAVARHTQKDPAARPRWPVDYQPVDPTRPDAWSRVEMPPRWEGAARGDWDGTGHPGAVPLSLPALQARADQALPWEVYGRLTEIGEVTVTGVTPQPPVKGEEYDVLDGEGAPMVRAKVVGVVREQAVLVPYGETDGIRAGSPLRLWTVAATALVGPSLLGRVADGLLRPLDGKGPLGGTVSVPLAARPLSAMSRPLITHPLDVGVRAINGLLAIGQGQRMGIFAGSGVGKSTLLGMLARYTDADVNVIALIGERGREVNEFLEGDLQAAGRARSVVIVATSDDPPLVRIRAAFLATAIAEYFRDQGQQVLLMMDSLTRLAQAQRAVGLSSGEPPTSKGYPPSVFELFPKLLERAGRVAGGGSITGVYTVLVEGDETTEPIADTARSILDGHIVLSRRLAEQGHYPAIDLLQSLSRVMPKLVPETHRQAAATIRSWLATYRAHEDLLSMGGYQTGTNPSLDVAVAMREAIQAFLAQPVGTRATMDEARQALSHLLQVGAATAARP